MLLKVRLEQKIGARSWCRGGWEGSLKQREMGFDLSFRKIPWQLWDGWMDGWAVWDGENEPVAREPPGKTGLCPWGWAADTDV